MLVLIILTIFLIFTYVFVAPKNIIVWYFALYAISFVMIIIASIFFVFKFSNYPNINNLDYRLYLYLQKFKLSLSAVRRIFNLGISLIMLSNVFFVWILNISSSKKSVLLLLLPIIFYTLLNSPEINEIFYVTQHKTDNPYVSYMLTYLNRFIAVYNKGVLIFYHVLPFYCLVRHYRQTRIRIKKHSIIITAACMILLYINIFYMLFGNLNLYFELDYHSFPAPGRFADIRMFWPTSFLFIITLIFGLLIFFQPFQNFTIMSGKASMINAGISAKNLRMFFHMQKNLFVTVSKFSQLSLEDCRNNPDRAYQNLRVIKKLSDNTIENISKNLNMIHMSKIKASDVLLYDLINNAFDSMNIPPNIKIDTVYPAEELHCFVDAAAITECFVNILSNAVEAIEMSGNPDGRITIIVDYDYDLICIDIIDNGCGIDKKNLNHIFKPLFSSKSTRKNYGLGLSYVKDVVILHHGYINIKSTVNAGTTVQIVLPKPSERRLILWRK